MTGLGNARFEEVYVRYDSGRLSCEEAADVLGMLVFLWRRRYETQQAAGPANEQHQDGVAS